MSSKYASTINRETKTHYGHYIFSPNEPWNNTSRKQSSNAKVNLVDDAYAVKKRIRRMAQSLRAN